MSTGKYREIGGRPHRGRLAPCRLRREGGASPAPTTDALNHAGQPAAKRRVGTLNRRGRSERGAALMLALAATLIISLIIFGIATSTTQDYILAHAQKDSASALNAAEAALNWELNKMSRLQYD